MAYEENLRSLTLDADASLGKYTGVPGSIGSVTTADAGNQYRFVKLVGKHACGRADATADQRIMGVLQNKPQVPGAACTVGYEGISKVVAAKALNAGDKVTVDAQGRATTGGTGSVVGDVIVGCSAAGELASVALRLGL